MTAPQLKVLKQLDAVKTAKEVVQTHVDTWLAPYVAELAVTERKDVLAAYLNATPQVQADVKGLLSLG